MLNRIAVLCVSGIFAASCRTPSNSSATKAAPGANSETYCNGQRVEFAGDLYYPNGKRVTVAGDDYYPNDHRIKVAGDVYYPNDHRALVAGDEYYMNDKRVKIAGDIYYPNDARFKIAGDCYYSNGKRMGSCTGTIKYEEKWEKFRLKGTIDANTGSISSLTYQYLEGDVKTEFIVHPNRGTVSEITATCKEDNDFEI